MDVSKSRIAVALAGGVRTGEVRFLGEIEASDTAVSKLVRRLSAKHGALKFCYEAGPTADMVFYRLLGALGHACQVVAPWLIPRRPGDRVKTNRRDALSLARLLRAGELTRVWAPDERHEAMRDLAGSASADRKRLVLPPPGARRAGQARPGRGGAVGGASDRMEGPDAAHRAIGRSSREAKRTPLR
jgi:transposase